MALQGVRIRQLVDDRGLRARAFSQEALGVPGQAHARTDGSNGDLVSGRDWLLWAVVILVVVVILIVIVQGSTFVPSGAVVGV